jgi:hypothetical protein
MMTNETSTERAARVQETATFIRQNLAEIGEELSKASVTEWTENYPLDDMTLDEVLTALNLH